MKGIVFTEFLEMVEQKFGYKMVDDLLISSDLPSQGVYTAVGTYSHHEMVSLVTQLSERSGIEASLLLDTFGSHIFQHFTSRYNHFFSSCTGAYEFLSSIEEHIHVEVQKLYPDAELPEFIISRPSEEVLSMVYKSERKLSFLAMGLIKSTLSYYGETAEIAMNDLSGDGHTVEFILTKV